LEKIIFETNFQKNYQNLIKFKFFNNFIENKFCSPDEMYEVIDDEEFEKIQKKMKIPQKSVKNKNKK
jgi:hypothetical protein